MKGMVKTAAPGVSVVLMYTFFQQPQQSLVFVSGYSNRDNVLEVEKVTKGRPPLTGWCSCWLDLI